MPKKQQKIDINIQKKAAKYKALLERSCVAYAELSALRERDEAKSKEVIEIRKKILKLTSENFKRWSQILTCYHQLVAEEVDALSSLINTTQAQKTEILNKIGFMQEAHQLHWKDIQRICFFRQEKVEEIHVTDQKNNIHRLNTSQIFLRILFPPLLLVDMLKIATSYLLGKWIGQFVLQGQRIYEEESCALLADKKYYHDIRTLPDNLSYKRFKVVTAENIQLQTLQISPKGLIEKAPNEQKFILRFEHTQGCFEYAVEEMGKLAEKFNCHVVGFNYRSVKNENKVNPRRVRSPDELVKDGIAQVQRILDTCPGIPPDNITLTSFSVGSAIAIKVAQHFAGQGVYLRLFCNSGFSNVTDTAVYMGPLYFKTRIKEAEAKKEKHIKIAINGRSRKVRIEFFKVGLFLTDNFVTRTYLKLVLKPFLWLTGWDMGEIVDAFASYPNKNKFYVTNINDDVIAAKASLDNGLRKVGQGAEQRILWLDTTRAMNNAMQQARDQLNNTEEKKPTHEEVEELAKKLIDFEKNKLKGSIVTSKPDQECNHSGRHHNCSIGKLFTKDNRTCEDYFHAFFKRKTVAEMDKEPPALTCHNLR